MDENARRSHRQQTKLGGFFQRSHDQPYNPNKSYPPAVFSNRNLTTSSIAPLNSKTRISPAFSTIFCNKKRSRGNTSSTNLGISSFRKEYKKARRPHRGSGFGLCPLCQASFPLHKLESHASICDGNDPSTNTNASKAEENKKQVTTPDFPIPGPRSALHLRPKRRLDKMENPSINATSPSWTSQPLPGLFLFEEFITEQEEKKLLQFLDEVDAVPWKQSRFNGQSQGKRWGVHCNLRDRRVDTPQNPLPEIIRNLLIPKLSCLGLRVRLDPNEANAIDYRRHKGDWLHPHVDDRKLSKEPIANLSLAGNCHMTFRNVAPNRNTGPTEATKVWLPRRCLQVLTGASRYDFSHGIANTDLASDRRVSITLRESPLTVSGPSNHPIPKTKSSPSTMTRIDQLFAKKNP